MKRYDIRRLIPTLLLMFGSIGTLVAQNSGIGVYPYEASPVKVGRELPRTQTVSYNSERGSLLRSHAPSLYMQPLAENWSRAELDGGRAVRYTHQYKIPFDWVDRQQLLYIGAVSGSYEIIINDKYAAYSQNGRTAAEFDITALSEEGVNTLDIIVYKDHAARVLENRQADENPSILGEVYIVSQPRVRIRDYAAKVNFEGSNAIVELGVALKTNMLNSRTVRLYYSILSPEGEQVASGYRDAELDMRREDTVRFVANIANARMWSHEAPNLYTLLLKTQFEGRYTEYVSYKIGLRTVGVEDGKLLINSSEVPLSVAEYGFERDLATTDAGLRKLKSEGINTIKVRGGPQQEPFYELCDRIGLYVCNQASIDTRGSGDSRRRGGNPSNDPVWEAAYIDRATGMYYNSRNHPSVIMFSIAENSANGYNLYESYLALKRIERNLPVVYVDARGEWNTDAVGSNIRNGNSQAVGNRIVFDVSPLRNVSLEKGPDITEVNSRQGTYRIHNNYYAAALRPATVSYKVRQGRRVMSEGTLEIDVRPQGTTEFTIDYGKAKAGTNLTVEFVVTRPAQYDYIPPLEAEEVGRTINMPAFLNRRDMEQKAVDKLGETTLSVAY